MAGFNIFFLVYLFIEYTSLFKITQYTLIMKLKKINKFNL